MKKGMSMAEKWDLEIDYLVAGSGVAGMSAAITAKLNGLDTLVVESMEKWGGTTAISGGWTMGTKQPTYDQRRRTGFTRKSF